MKRFLIKILVYFVISVIITNGVAYICLYILRNSDIYKPSFLLRNYSSNDSIDFDYIVLGSSTALTGIDTEQLDDLWKTNGLNLGMHGMGYGGLQIMLSHFLSNGYLSKYCIITIDDNISITDDGISNQEFCFLPYISKSYVNESFKKREKGFVKPMYFSKYFPMIGVAYYNHQLFASSIIALFNPRYKRNFDARGNKIYPAEIKFRGSTELVLDTLQINNIYFSQIEQLCKENNIELIYYLAPYFAHEMFIPENISKNAKIINFRDLIQDESCFYDNIHINAKGRSYATETLTDRLKKIEEGIPN